MFLICFTDFYLCSSENFIKFEEKGSDQYIFLQYKERLFHFVWFFETSFYSSPKLAKNLTV